MINAGYSDEEIHEVFRYSCDYKREKTQYMIDHARRRKYKPFSWRRLIELVKV